MLAWLLLSQIKTSDIQFDVRPHEGLTVSSNGVPVIRGSGFQYYAPGWTKGYYSSRWQDQVVRRIDDRTIEVQFNEGGASGTITYRKNGNQLSIDHEFNWSGNGEALVELNNGLIWVPPFRNARATFDGTSRTLPQLAPIGGLDKRLLSSPAKVTSFLSQVASVSLTSSELATTFDGRKYDQEWAEAAPVYWQGIPALAVHRGSPTKVHSEYVIGVEAPTPGAPKKLVLAPILVKDGVMPDETVPPIIPNPKMSVLDWDHALTVSNLWKFPAGRPKFFDLFRGELEKRFEMPEVGSLENRIAFDGGMSDFKQREGTYHLKITKDSISVYGQEAAGLRNAMYRLAQMAFIRDGKVCLPTGVIEDEPRSDFRGVHLFVGPNALEFHQKLWSNVLRPLGFNKVVLECERTNWASMGPTIDPATMKLADLAKLFKWYRSQEVEPIPLIQSLGHMDWLLRADSRKDFAINPSVPYTLDPRKPGAKELIGGIWSEVFTTLKPTTIHVGLDEVDLRGFATKNPELKTELWKEMLGYLGGMAKQNQVNLMLWGDEGLAPNEAIDAANGDDAGNAAKRRAAIPKGSMIADWHYKADQAHVPFLKSLQKWKLEGFRPIASTWYRPENVRGFDVAADVEGVGTLQTTWAGTESDEAHMFRSLNQFTAMVLAGDYGWSGRAEKIEQLPYSAANIFAKMYNPIQSPLAASPAQLFGRGPIFQCGHVKFSLLEGMALPGITPGGLTAPESLEISLNGTAKEVAFALGCDAPSADSEIIAEMTLVYADGTQDKSPIYYGHHVRSADDAGSTLFGERKNDLTCFRFKTKPKALKNVTFRSTNRYSGLTINGITLVPFKGAKSSSSG
ncbi:MAG: hypothetical protein WCG75_00425 [Armatimonadota bacterium]